MEEGNLSREFKFKDQKEFYDSHLTDSLAEVDQELEPKITKDPIGVDRTPVAMEVVKSKWTGLAKEHGLYTESQISELLNRNEELLAGLGFTELAIVPDSAIVGYDKTVYSVKINALDRKGVAVIGWVTIDSEKEKEPTGYDNKLQVTGNILYEVHLPGLEQTLEVAKPAQGFEFEWLQTNSESAKVVKSRPMFMYPDLFDLSPEKVWPRGGEVAVIGDPFQACDKEGVTIVEYEYADEMVPPILRLWLEHSDKIKEGVENWISSLYFEDMNALERVYGQFSPGNADNPYFAFAELCQSVAGKVAVEMITAKPLSEDLKREIKKLKSMGEGFRNGHWTMDDGKNVLVDRARAYPKRGFSEEGFSELPVWFEYKQSSVEGLGKPEFWEEYISLWDHYIDNLPIERLGSIIANFDKKLDQAKHWLGVLPITKSPERSMSGRNYLADFYSEIAMCKDDNDFELANLRESDIQYIEEKGIGTTGPLGYFTPGYPLNGRNRRTLTEMMDRIGQMGKYADFIFPKLQAEQKRIEESGVPLSKEMKYEYLSQIEKVLAQQAFFHKRTQKAVPVHGFFPHNMPDINPQDRILALTSVTMHGWNKMDYDGFKKDLVPAISFLKVGGKYILGPINQEVYFGHYGSNFRCEDLTSVLRELADAGQISYEFKKGVKPDHSEYDTVEEDSTEAWSKDSSELLEGESAHSLVITRLK